MFRIFAIILLTSITLNGFANETSLTIQQQLERLQREVSDLSKSVFSSSDNSIKNTTNESDDLVQNLSAIDMRIYDLEKDVKNLNANLEEIFFDIEDLTKTINSFEELILNIEKNIKNVDNSSIVKNNDNNLDTVSNNENSLGSLKISKQDDLGTLDEEKNNLTDNEISNNTKNLSPEDQFQQAFDNIRKKNWQEAKISLKNFIEKNSENQLSGSAHYWLGELHLLEKKYRDAALIFAEGYQKFPDSIKAPDMLFKLSQALFKVDKKNESCKTMEKFLEDYPKNKLAKKTKNQIIEYECLVDNQ